MSVGRRGVSSVVGGRRRCRRRCSLGEDVNTATKWVTTVIAGQVKHVRTTVEQP